MRILMTIKFVSKEWIDVEMRRAWTSTKSTSQRHWEKVGRAKDRSLAVEIAFRLFSWKLWFALMVRACFDNLLRWEPWFVFITCFLGKLTSCVNLGLYSSFLFVFGSAIAFAGLCLCTDHLLSLEVMLRLLCLSSNLAWMGGTLLITNQRL